MEIKLDGHKRKEAITSLQRYFEENLPESIGELPAGLLLNFILEEIGPAIYNRGLADMKVSMQTRLEDVEGELFAEEFQYWKPKKGVRRGR